MGKLRSNSTEDFPVESRSGNVGYLLIHDNLRKKVRKTILNPHAEEIEDRFGEEEYDVSFEHFKSTKTEKTSLLKTLHEVPDEAVTLLGYWAGKHRTDIHELELPRYVERMENAEL